jgi:hypothetical protein
MIEFNNDDYHMKEIAKEAKLFNLLTRNKYRVFGLKQEGNPPITIRYNEDNHDIWSFEPPIRSFFTKNGMDVSFDYIEGDRSITIGLRRDVRKDLLLSAAIVQTIVYYGEKRLELNGTYKVLGLDKFGVETSKEEEI